MKIMGKIQLTSWTATAYTNWLLTAGRRQMYPLGNANPFPLINYILQSFFVWLHPAGLPINTTISVSVKSSFLHRYMFDCHHGI